MSMRIHKFATYFRPEDAYTLIEFIDQLRESLMQNYGAEISVLLQEATSQQQQAPGCEFDDDVMF